MTNYRYQGNLRDSTSAYITLDAGTTWIAAPGVVALTGTTGIAGADAKCNWATLAGLEVDANYPDYGKPLTSTYKAMLVDETGCGGGTCRQACTFPNCINFGTNAQI